LAKPALVALHPELVLSHGTPSTATLLQQTRTLPILFVNVTDPVGSGFLTSFAKPGGNVTGFINMATIAGKWLQLLKEIAPRVTRCAILFNPTAAPYAEYFLAPFKAAAASFASRQSFQGSAMPRTLKPRSSHWQENRMAVSS